MTGSLLAIDSASICSNLHTLGWPTTPDLISTLNSTKSESTINSEPSSNPCLVPKCTLCAKAKQKGARVLRTMVLTSDTRLVQHTHNNWMQIWGRYQNTHNNWMQIWGRYQNKCCNSQYRHPRRESKFTQGMCPSYLVRKEPRSYGLRVHNYALVTWLPLTQTLTCTNAHTYIYHTYIHAHTHAPTAHQLPDILEVDVKQLFEAWSLDLDHHLLSIHRGQVDLQAMYNHSTVVLW